MRRTRTVHITVRCVTESHGGNFIFLLSSSSSTVRPYSFLFLFQSSSPLVFALLCFALLSFSNDSRGSKNGIPVRHRLGPTTAIGTDRFFPTCEQRCFLFCLFLLSAPSPSPSDCCPRCKLPLLRHSFTFFFLTRPSPVESS